MIFPVARRLWIAALVFSLAGPLPAAAAQQLSRSAGAKFQEAIGHLRAERFPQAEQLLVALVRDFPNHADIQEALAIVLTAQDKVETATSHFEKVARLNPRSPRAHQNLGANYLRLGRLAGAEREFQAAIQLDPRSPNAHFNLGSLYLSQQSFDKALPHLQQAQKLQPDNPANSFKLATCYFYLRRHEEAGVLLALLESRGAAQVDVLTLLGSNLKALGQEKRATQVFGRVLDRLPPSAEAHVNLAQMFFQLGMGAEAVPVLERAREKDRESVQVAYLLALAHQAAGEGEKAKRAAQDAISRQETADLHHLLGEANESLGEYLEAVRHFQRAAEMEPSERNLFSLGYEFLIHWNWDASAAVFQRGREMHPQSVQLLLGLAAAYYSQGDFDQTIQVLLQGAEEAPDNAMVHSMMVVAYPLSTGFTKTVQVRLRLFHQRHPDDPWANYYYGFSLAQPPEQRPGEEDVAEALKLFRRAVELKSDLSEAQYQLGMLYFGQSQWTKAIDAFEAAVEANPGYVEAHYQLALSYQRTGRRPQARAALARYRDLKEQQDAELDSREAARTKFIYTLKP